MSKLVSLDALSAYIRDADYIDVYHSENNVNEPVSLTFEEPDAQYTFHIPMSDLDKLYEIATTGDEFALAQGCNDGACGKVFEGDTIRHWTLTHWSVA